VDEEPNEHLQVDLLAAEGQTFADQVSDTQAQGGVEAFDMLSAPDAVETTEDDGLASGEAVCVTDRPQIGNREQVDFATTRRLLHHLADR